MTRSEVINIFKIVYFTVISLTAVLGWSLKPVFSKNFLPAEMQKNDILSLSLTDEPNCKT